MPQDINICPSLMGLNKAFYRAMYDECRRIRGDNGWEVDPKNYWFSDMTFNFIGM